MVFNKGEVDWNVWVGMDVDEDGETERTWEDSIVHVEGRNIIKLEIISDDIMNYDRYVFDILRSESNNTIKDTIREIYRPYLLEYYIDLDEKDERQSNFLQQMFQGNGWYGAYLVDENTDIDSSDSIIFKGVFAHSTSPVEYENRKLVIKANKADKVAFDKINKTYDTSKINPADDNEIKMKLKELFEGVSFVKTDVYKVGNGNCIINYVNKNEEDEERRFFYDIGYGTGACTGVKYKDALESINSKTISNLNCIILSHWDTDHFNGYVYANENIYNIMWIAPFIENKEKKLNAKRLMSYLDSINRLMVVARNPARKAIEIVCSVNSKMILYVGGKKRGIDNKITSCNREGIALYMENDKTSSGKIRCLMLGDVPYKSLPEAANFSGENPYDYLVAPHHGAEMDCSLLQKPNVPDKNRGQAVICCDGNSENNRPNEKHLKALQECYEKVMNTESAIISYIELDLQKKDN
jgi:beta-lactamase superfamily II metal-dependent hydrolase